ncbi:MAG: Hpt domain-containing protein, partial [Methylophilaceae bacterium]
MVEEFDIGPLTWVKDEIDQALRSVLDNVAAVSANPADVASLKFSQTHLYQVSGALDMVGLEGCKRFCAEIGNLTSKLEKQTIAVTPEVLSALIQAVGTLSSYLQELLNGAADIPARLFPTLQSMLVLQGESAEESELFFPDTSLRAPKDIPSIQLEEDALPAYLAEQRILFQKSLLSWLQSQNQGTKGDEGLQGMIAALENVQQAQQQSSQKTLWWAASGFAEALSQAEVARNPNVKKLCRRLDQQLRALAEGANRATGNLLRDVLYYIAISAPTTERIAKVKDVFELDHLMPRADVAATIPGETSAAELEVADQLLTSIDIVKDMWAAVSEGKSDALGTFLSKLGEMVEAGGKLESPVLANMFASIQEFANSLQAGVQQINDHSVIEVAAGLALAEDALRDYSHIDAEAIQRLNTQAQRIKASQGEGVGDASMLDQELGQDVLLAVAQQIKEALKVAEQSLDTFFRNPAEVEILQAVGKPLQQVVAAFDMLNMAVPTSVAKSSLALVEYFRHATPDQALFELVAESLSMLGLYVDELPRVRPESEAALQADLGRLQEQLLLLNVDSEAPLTADADKSSEPALAVPASDEKTTDRAHDSELLDIYLSEAEEVLANVAQNMQALRVNATANDALVEVRRGFHTLKGSGRAVGLSNIGEVAWAVEKLLNTLMERKLTPDSALIGFVEQAGAAFAGWVAELRENGAVDVSPHTWQQQSAALEAALATQKSKAVPEEVIIGGTHKISRALFNIFMAEAEQHMLVLRQSLAELSTEEVNKPSDASRRAAHTLASNAGTAGFKAMCTLARALEHWLDAHQGHWVPKSITLYENVVNALGKMLEKAALLRQPKQVTALLTALKEATISAGVAELEPSQPDITEEPPIESAQVEMPAEPEPADASVSATPEIVTAESAVPEQAEEHAAEAVSVKLPQPAKSTVVDDELLTMFVEEARELVPTVGNELRAWRNDPQESEHPDELQRALHTLKGSARMAGQSALADTVHDMEDRVMRALKAKNATIDFDGLFVDLDQIGGLLEEAVNLTSGEDKPDVARPGRSPERGAQYLRMRAEVLDRLINEAGEISIARSRMDREMQGFKHFSLDLTESVFRLRNQLREMEIEAESQLQSRMAFLQEANETFDPLEFDRFTRLQELTRMMAESVNDVATIQHGLLMNLDETESALQQQNRMNRELQHGLMNVRMVPFSMVSERLQRIVRQTSRELSKPVEMLIDGETVNIDRSVLDKIGAPLEHLLRNAVAHGMETPAERKKSKKNAMGNVTLKVRRENDEIVIIVTDDGAGINLEKVRKKAVEKGLFAANQEVSEQALMQVIFESGFSTATTVTQIAGRGVGLDSVRSDITALGGRIDVNNSPGHGAVFSIYLPVTLSVAQVVVVRVGSRTFALPSVMVEQVQKLKPAAIAAGYEARGITWNNRQYPLHFLNKLVGDVEHSPEPQLYTPLLLLRSGTYQIALHVDEIVGNQEVVMKPIGPQLARVPGMMGATVMGDGNIVLILNAVQLANREDLAIGTVKVSSTPAAPVAVEEEMPTILVVDDSLTMRKVLGRLLEREGYRVVIAKDGMDALQVLQDISPDIILTDIEMPRMDGFELTRNIRGDARFAETPLVIISSRTAEKHRNL